MRLGQYIQPYFANLIVLTFEDRNTESLKLKFFTLKRNSARPVHYPAPRGFNLLVLDGHSNDLGEFFEGHSGIHDEIVRTHPLTQGRFAVMLVVNLAKDFLEHVLERNKAVRAAVFIRNNGYMLRRLLELLQQIVHGFRVRHVQDLLDETSDICIVRLGIE